MTDTNGAGREMAKDCRTAWTHPLPFAAVELGEKEKINWLRLWRTQNVGPRTFHHLLQRFGTVAQALAQLPLHMDRLKARKFTIPSVPSMEKEYHAYKGYGADVVGWCEPHYPPLLRLCPDAPPVLIVKGRRDILTTPLFAIVGARNASAVGKKLAHQFASTLGKAGLTIVSGLARGIDISAHEGSLSTGTVAVLPGGMDHLYPPEHEAFAGAIAREGALICEMPLGMPPSSRLFPRRNRLIAGLSQGLLVMEAALRSGTLLTAQYAAEQGREVFVVPGHPLDPRSAGGNALIRDGAALVQNPTDILDVYASLPGLACPPLCQRSPQLSLSLGEQQSPPPTDLPEKVLASLSLTPVRVDELAAQLRVSASFVRAALVEIEIAGYLDRQTGDYVCRLPTVDG